MNGKLFLGDKLLIILVLASVIGVSVMRAHSSKVPSAGGEFIVYLQNAEYGRFDLSKDGVLEVNGIKIGVASGSVRVLEINCGRRICQHSAISRPGQSIICVPNRLMIEIAGGGNNIDSVTY
jgi:hypothetical protein